MLATVINVLLQTSLQTWNQYLSEHKRRFPKIKTVNDNTSPAEDEGAFMFDAIWTAALALNRTETRLRKKHLTLTNFTYDDVHNISGMIYEEALDVKFFGLTVSYSDSHNCILASSLLIYIRTAVIT